MRLGRRTRGPRRIALLSAAVMLAPLLTVGWLGWTLIAQERELDDKRVGDWLDSRAGRIASELERRLDRMVASLPDPSDEPARISDSSADAVSLTFTSGGIRAWPPGRLPYYPAPPVVEKAPPDGLFAAADLLELRDRKYLDAVARLRLLLTAGDAAVRTRAWLGIARNYVHLEEFDKAFSAYAELERLGRTPRPETRQVSGGVVTRRARRRSRISET
jgi:hypothetical protein